MHAYRHHANMVESVTTLNNSLYANVLKIMKDPRALVGITTNNSTKYIFHLYARGVPYAHALIYIL